jgi:hypothetical protein
MADFGNVIDAIGIHGGNVALGAGEGLDDDDLELQR